MVSSNPFDNPEVSPVFWSAQDRIDGARWLSKNTKVDQIRKNLAYVKNSLAKILAGQENPPPNEPLDVCLMRLKTMTEIWSMALSMALAN